jgi:hypothetical protein
MTSRAEFQHLGRHLAWLMRHGNREAIVRRFIESAPRDARLGLEMLYEQWQ